MHENITNKSDVRTRSSLANTHQVTLY